MAQHTKNSLEPVSKRSFLYERDRNTSISQSSNAVLKVALKNRGPFDVRFCKPASVRTALVVPLLFGTLALLGCSQGASDVRATRAATSKQVASAQETDSELMVYGKVPYFELTDQSGEKFQSDTLTGQVYLTTFFFTTCPTTCPQQSRELSALQDMDGLSMLSITVQPNVDTPETLLRYSVQYKADLTRWHFLTGTRDAIWNLSQTGFMLPVGDAPEPGDMPIFHSSKIILVDREQQIRGFYESQVRSEMVQLRAHAKRLLQESAANDSRPADDVEDEELSKLQENLQGAFNSADPGKEP